MVRIHPIGLQLSVLSGYDGVRDFRPRTKKSPSRRPGSSTSGQTKYLNRIRWPGSWFPIHQTCRAWRWSSDLGQLDCSLFSRRCISQSTGLRPNQIHQNLTGTHRGLSQRVSSHNYITGLGLSIYTWALGFSYNLANSKELDQLSSLNRTLSQVSSRTLCLPTPPSNPSRHCQSPQPQLATTWRRGQSHL